MISLLGLSQDLSVQEALSGIFGSISLATWIFLLVPQLILNYRSQSADGVSLAFLTVWFIGDITNLAGAIWADLVPTVVVLAIYFCIADFVLIGQCLYYNKKNAQKHRETESTAPTEEDPLLTRRRSNSSIGLPGSHRRRSSAISGNQHHEDTLTKILEEEDSSDGNAWVRNVVSVLLVIAAGTAGWAIAWRSGVWIPTPENGGDVPKTNDVAVGAEVLGYFSAICYLGARIPQILKNYKEKSCDGLALLFFLLSLMGNLTYGAGILFHSLEKEYLIVNTPWLIGSLGTIVEDAVIFLQFRMYAPKQTSTSAVE
ncbi:hypothetical protein sscle_07g055390 [Sclerotinia sclerotiorum 1980 UF-70]|uniref:Vacuolar membrane PQ loop repeat protein n=1 Tax=Sclerotinia sclerotiorum (strain ATCC 18683 / 1980 / Ss-1) TaxID=665079 RepID=A0A1D9Q798_SCLS1|nr:hypothetical protein sscle_07g055390 [Sclerotinia sclerotiorum 1980 UF-70]